GRRAGHAVTPVGAVGAPARGGTRSVRRLLALQDGRRRVRRSAAGIPASRALPLRLLHLARGRTDDRGTPGDARLVRCDGVVARSTPFRTARSGAPPVSGTVLRSCARDRAPEPALPHLRSHHSPAAALVDGDPPATGILPPLSPSGGPVDPRRAVCRRWPVAAACEANRGSDLDARHGGVARVAVAR